MHFEFFLILRTASWEDEGRIDFALGSGQFRKDREVLAQQSRAHAADWLSIRRNSKEDLDLPKLTGAIIILPDL